MLQPTELTDGRSQTIASQGRDAMSDHEWVKQARKGNTLFNFAQSSLISAQSTRL